MGGEIPVGPLADTAPWPVDDDIFRLSTDTMHTIGIIGGMGWEASAAYYRLINQEVRARLGGWHSARILLDSLDFDPIAKARTKQDYMAVRDTLLASSKRLQGAGAELLVIACNTVHRFSAQLQASVDIPLLHIAEVSAAALRDDRRTRVGLLGTRATMGGGFYPRFLQAAGVEVVLPPPEARAELHERILREWTGGERPVADADALTPHVQRFVTQGCDCVLLACTDFGLAFGGSGPPIIAADLPLYDSTVLHARAAVDWALEPHRGRANAACHGSSSSDFGAPS